MSSSENDEGIASPVNDLSRKGSEKRAKLRAEKRFKRKSIQSAKKASAVTGGDDDGGILGNVIEALNTKEKIHSAAAKLGPGVLRKWTMLLMKEIRSSKPSIGPNELMKLITFNALNLFGYVKFTPETYTVDVNALKDRSIYEEEVMADEDVKTLHLKRERNARVSAKWRDYKFLKADEAKRKGRIAEFADFKRLRQSTVTAIEAKAIWKEYNKTWYLLMGLKPSCTSEKLCEQQMVAADMEGEDDDNEMNVYGGEVEETYFEDD
jgi:hypothetical protein